MKRNPVEYAIEAYRPRRITDVPQRTSNGVGELARHLGVPPKTIRRWREKGWFPAERIADVISGALDRGIEVDLRRLVPARSVKV